jgi:hypothetical protein
MNAEPGLPGTAPRLATPVALLTLLAGVSVLAGCRARRRIEEIMGGRGTAYATNAVDACLRLYREKGYSIAP